MENTLTSLEQIIQNYEMVERLLVFELQALHARGTTLEIGEYCEEVWSEMFQKIIPKKFSILRNGVIMDSRGLYSPEVDIVIYDKEYVPYMFQYGETKKIVPIEAVFAAVKCQNFETNEMEYSDETQESFYLLEEWMKGVKILRVHSADAYAYLSEHHETYPRQTTPIMILCSIEKRVSGNAEGMFDIEVIAGDRLEVVNHRETDTYGELLMHFNGKEQGYEVTNTSSMYEKNIFEQSKELKNGILKLSFILNQMLLLINTPVVFSHFAYAQTFREIEQQHDIKKEAYRKRKSEAQSK